MGKLDKIPSNILSFIVSGCIFYGMLCLSMVWKLNIVGTYCRKLSWNINWGNVCSNFQRLLQSYLFRLLEFTKEFTRTLYRLDSRVLGEETYLLSIGPLSKQPLPRRDCVQFERGWNNGRKLSSPPELDHHRPGALTTELEKYTHLLQR